MLDFMVVVMALSNNVAASSANIFPAFWSYNVMHLFLNSDWKDSFITVLNKSHILDFTNLIWICISLKLTNFPFFIYIFSFISISQKWRFTHKVQVNIPLFLWEFDWTVQDSWLPLSIHLDDKLDTVSTAHRQTSLKHNRLS